MCCGRTMDRIREWAGRFPIRTKLMLIYFTFSAVLLATLLPTVYSTVKYSLYQSLASTLQIQLTQMMTGAQIENSSQATLGTEKIGRGIEVAIFYGDGDLMYSSTKESWIACAFDVPNRELLQVGDDTWMVVRQEYEFAEGDEQIVVACGKLGLIQSSINNLRLLLVALTPLYLFLSAFFARLIAGRALRPIARITETACSIRDGDLSRRIADIKTRDEVGELADAFNSMISQVEDSFQRERQFSSDASHELRTPVAVILACAEDSLQERQSPETSQNLRSIQREGERINQIIAQLLTLTRGYEGRYRLELETFSLQEMMESLLEELADLAEQNQIQLSSTVGAEVELEADQWLITQLLVNLLNNAIKYGRPGGSVTVSAEGNDWKTVIRIADDGIGISSQDLPHIFERFYRADRARNRTGSGLGLSIVQWIVQVHHGSIAAESELGKGTTFSVTLPRRQGVELPETRTGKGKKKLRRKA